MAEMTAARSHHFVIHWSITPLLRYDLPPLPVDFVEENRRGGADVQRIHRGRHGNGHRFIAGFQNGRGNAVAFAAEDDAAIAGKIRLRQKFLFVCGCAAMQRTPRARKFLQAFNERLGRGVRFGGELMPLAEFRQFDDRQLQNRAHGIADGAAQKRAAGSFADNQRLDAERDAVAHQRAEIFRARQRVHGHEEQRFRVFRQNVVERSGRGNFPDGEHGLDTSKSR